MQWNGHGVDVTYTRSGEGRPVLMLHGWMDSKIRFDVFLNGLTARGNECIAIDFPGHGESSLPPSAWSVTEFAAMTIAFLDDIGIEKCDIIAHSFGARVAIKMASDAPERFNRLVLTGAAGLIPKRGPKYYIKTSIYKIGKRLRKIAFFNRLFKLDEKMKNAGSDDYRSLSGVMRETFVRVVNQNLRDYLPKISTPTLLVWGENDQATPLWMGEDMEKNIPDAALIVFEGGSHYAFIEQNVRFFKILDSFLWK